MLEYSKTTPFWTDLQHVFFQILKISVMKMLQYSSFFSATITFRYIASCLNTPKTIQFEKLTELRMESNYIHICTLIMRNNFTYSAFALLKSN